MSDDKGLKMDQTLLKMLFIDNTHQICSAKKVADLDVIAAPLRADRFLWASVRIDGNRKKFSIR